MNARREHESKEPKFEYQGPLDILIVSPPKGEPWFIYFKKDQMSKHGAFQQMKMYIKGYSIGNTRWSFTFDKKDRWHSVRRPAPCDALATRLPFQHRAPPD